jgi:hypothetical protein
MCNTILNGVKGEFHLIDACVAAQASISPFEV